MITPKIVIVRAIQETYAELIAKEIKLAGSSCGITDIKNLEKYLEKNGHFPGKTIIHSRTAHPNQVYKILKNLEQQGYRIINSASAIKLTSDKFNSCVYAKEKKIPCAETFKVDKKQAILYIKNRIKQWEQVVVKPITSQGQGEFCFKFNNTNIRHIDKINRIPVKELVVQRFIDYTRLNRVVVIGFKALKQAVFYDSPHKGWKCSVCLNPSVKNYNNPSQELLRFAENVAKKFKAEISFIDIFSTSKGYFLNEINIACSLVMHEKISKYNISKKIANYLILSN